MGFEYLIVTERADGTEHKEVVDFGGLLGHVENAVNKDDYCFWAYEIHQIAVDFSIPREAHDKSMEKKCRPMTGRERLLELYEKELDAWARYGAAKADLINAKHDAYKASSDIWRLELEARETIGRATLP